MGGVEGGGERSDELKIVSYSGGRYVAFAVTLLWPPSNVRSHLSSTVKGASGDGNLTLCRVVTAAMEKTASLTSIAASTAWG